MDRQDLLARTDGKTRGNEYGMRRARYKNNMKKFWFPNRSIDYWNGLEIEIIMSKKNNHEFNTKTCKKTWRHGSISLAQILYTTTW